MFTSAQDAIEARETLTESQAAHELKRHGFTLEEYLADGGKLDTASVLNWLGY